MVETGTVDKEGLVLWAREQTAGRGRSGRTWVSAPGNLYVSIILSAPESAAIAPQIGFVAALSVIGAIQAVAPDRGSDGLLACKWPNDVLLAGGKVAGLLAETCTSPEGQNWVIVGIGVNINPVTVAEARYPLASLAEHGMAVGAPRLLEALLHDFYGRLERWRRDGFEPVRFEWVSRAARLGQDLTVATVSGELRGTFAGLDVDGAMLLKLAGGSGQQRVLAGDVLR